MSDDAPQTTQTEAATRVRMLLAYDGKPFRGFAHQPYVRTVAGDLMEAIGQIFGEVPDITCAGRTDAGVHAWGQVIHFDLPQSKFDAVGKDRLQQSINKMCGPAIVVRHIRNCGA